MSLMLPLFGFCEGWLEVFSSKEKAESYMEAIDVENGEWLLFDRAGKRLDLVVTTEQHRFAFLASDKVEICSPVDEEVGNTARFHELLIAHLHRTSEENSKLAGRTLDDLTFEQLLDLAEEVEKIH